MIKPPQVSFVLVPDARGGERREQLADLESQIAKLDGVGDVSLKPGASTVVATVPARNQRQSNAMKKLLNDRLAGWTVRDLTAYDAPETF